MNKRHIGIVAICFILICQLNDVFSQDANGLMEKVKQKLLSVKDYSASGMMKTDVIFLKVPLSPIESYYLSPDKFQITRKSGVSLLPKGGIGINLSALILTNDYTIVNAGDIRWQNISLKVLKLIPLTENNIVITTLYIDPVNYLIRRASTTTKENGTYDLELYYNRYISWGLPDKIFFYFNTKDYKLPKGITFEYDDGTKIKDLPKNKKGKIEILYSSYTINKGIAKARFNSK